tara:strand:- start:123 stop:563 length:441 start_codon:yes stop_codon:yes gene_type:complete
MAGRFNLEPGLNFVGAYQVSGRPYVSGAIDCNVDARLMTDCEFTFPYVARWFKVINHDESNACRVGFSISGVTGSNNYFTVGPADLAAGHGPTDSGVLELKVSSIVVSGSTNIDIIAGLTTIGVNKTSTGTPPGSGPNWSGSSGVG